MTPLAAMFAALGDCPPWYRPLARYQWRRRYVRTAITVAVIAVLRESAEEFVRLIGVQARIRLDGAEHAERKETN